MKLVVVGAVPVLLAVGRSISVSGPELDDVFGFAHAISCYVLAPELSRRRSRQA
jgi:hypothetical protein